MKTRWEIQTGFTYGWENCWTVDGKPETFATKKEAIAAMAEYVQERADEGMDSDDLRVAKVALT